MNVIVTGASKGIGKAIAMKFAVAGHQLFLCARNKEQLVSAANDIRSHCPVAVVHTMTADLSIKKEVISFAAWVERHGPADILVNNAGVYLPGNITDEVDGFLESMMNTNLYSAYYLTRALVPAMIKNGSGHIFNICSVASLKAYDGGGGYSVSKFAMYGFSQNLRHELKSHRIKVTAVMPGATLTDSWGNYDNSNKRIMEATDIAVMVYAATQVSTQAVVDEIHITPQLGEL